MLNDFVSHDFSESKTPSLWNDLDAFKCVLVYGMYVSFTLVIGVRKWRRLILIKKQRKLF